MKRQLLADMNALASAMIDNAMPVLKRVESPERAGMYTPEDTRELARRSLDVLRQVIPQELYAVFEEFIRTIAPMIDEIERRKGLLMTESTAPAPSNLTPDAAQGAPTPDTGKE